MLAVAGCRRWRPAAGATAGTRRSRSWSPSSFPTSPTSAAMDPLWGAYRRLGSVRVPGCGDGAARELGVRRVGAQLPARLRGVARAGARGGRGAPPRALERDARRPTRRTCDESPLPRAGAEAGSPFYVPVPEAEVTRIAAVGGPRRAGRRRARPGTRRCSRGWYAWSSPRTVIRCCGACTSRAPIVHGSTGCGPVREVTSAAGVRYVVNAAGFRDAPRTPDPPPRRPPARSAGRFRRLRLRRERWMRPSRAARASARRARIPVGR